MNFPQGIIWLLLFLLALYVLFVAYKLLHELRFRRKPYIALKELIYQHQNPIAANEILHEVILFGDFGYISPAGTDTVQQALKKLLPVTGPKTTLALLGDNIYPVGLPPKNHRHRKLAEAKLQTQVNLFNHFGGNVIYLSGNHDWNKGRPNGYQQLLRQEAFVTGQLGPVYLPAHGCPGPVLVEVNSRLALIAINTQWWVQKGEKPIGKAMNCGVDSEKEFFERFRQMLTDNSHRNVLVLAHHPLYSNALHGGKHTVKQHIFPLTAAHKKLYIPVPVAGSLYPLYRKLIGAAEDMSHPRYRKMRKKLLRILKQYSNVIYTAGHDHNLQHFRRHGNHYIISGSASKTSFVSRGGKASFTHEHLGFFKVLYYQNGQVWLQALEPDLAQNNGSVNLVYQAQLYGPAVANEY